MHGSVGDGVLTVYVLLRQVWLLPPFERQIERGRAARGTQGRRLVLSRIGPCQTVEA